MEISDRLCAMTLFTEYPIGKCAAKAVPRRRNKIMKIYMITQSGECLRRG